jgi:hypothetical protein
MAETNRIIPQVKLKENAVIGNLTYGLCSKVGHKLLNVSKRNRGTREGNGMKNLSP